jgi:hypothetical protein
MQGNGGFMSQRRITLFLASVLALGSGCSNLADENSRPPPLAQIAGTLTLADGVEVPDEQLRVTLLWETEESANISDQLSQPTECFATRKLLELEPQVVELDGTFPNAFTLDIAEPPPPEAMLTADGEGSPRIAAQATLVVYADGDGDGMLDSRSAGAPSPDRVLATTDPERWRSYIGNEPIQHEVMYYTEPYSFESGPFNLDFPAGFSIMRYSLVQGESAVVPIDTPIDLRITGAPYLQDLLCESLCGEYEEVECPANPNDLPQPPSGAVEFFGGNTGQPGFGWSEEGDGRHVTLQKICDASGFSWNRVTCEGCTCWNAGCFYARADVAQEHWPCAE